MITRRGVMRGTAATGAAMLFPRGLRAQDRYDQAHLLQFDAVGTVTLIHIGDTFGQYHPHLRRPAHDKRARTDQSHLPEHLTDELLRVRFGIGGRQPMDYALTAAHFEEDVSAYGPMGGMAHVASVVSAIQAQRVGAVLLAGEDVREKLGVQSAALDAAVVLFSVSDTQEIPEFAEKVAKAKTEGRVVICRSRLGMSANRALAERAPMIDVLFCEGDAPAFPEPVRIGKTQIIASGTQGRFVTRLDLQIEGGAIVRSMHRLIPVFSDLLDETSVDGIVSPDETILGQADQLLYRAGTLRSSWDDLLCRALTSQTGARVALVPGEQHGVSVLAGQAITQHAVDSVLWGHDGATTVSQMTGGQIKTLLEDSAEAVFSGDPMAQNAAALVRVGGLRFALEPDATRGERVRNLSDNLDVPITPAKVYSVASWGMQVNGMTGIPMREAVKRYLAQRAATPD